ncbi:MAG TPA: bifunctional [glutamine synthetase] adenylyltransferase/[glutamine synthetase]-adenylyl-L-tyrosine phosphorylase [Acidimicrobiia bacterium]|nr:bifunctional [glutamine synthetase] adenylyltransferase/[glutamine synthetase]-adenylyl-L-tyrosine phosphorylase [Acidimicrobiia bacterium]
MAVDLDAPGLREPIEASADPGAVRLALTRILEAQPELAAPLADDDLTRRALVAVVAASRSLTRAIETDPAALDALANPDAFAAERDAAAMLDAGSAAVVGTEDPRRALRRWKRRELFRIAARDLVGGADLPAVGRELAALAEACLRLAVDLAAPTGSMAVIGMGKLGGAELNYSSDVDVLFVHGDGTASADAERAARAVLSVMAEPGPDGIVFRTDANLRPEGRAGPLSRDLASYAAYWERWAEAWELQALLKARPVAGDPDLGAAFAAASSELVWSDVIDPDAIRAIRALKARSEQELRRTGSAHRELKRGPGGIRDIEFSVQLLQLVHGRHDAEIRSRSTLGALAELARHGYVGASEAGALDDSYRFLRTVEHRLQLVDEHQVHALPEDERARSRIARVLGYRDSADATAAAQFEQELRRHQGRVRASHERLFFRPVLETLAGSGRLTPSAAQERLAAFGFGDVERMRGALRELTEGLSRQSRLMEQMFPLLLEWLSASPDPDLGLLQLRTLAEGASRSATVAAAFRESTGAAERVCRLLGASRVVGQALRRNPGVVIQLGDDAYLATEKSHADFAQEARHALAWRGDATEHQQGVRRFKRRELLRTAARDLLGFAGVEGVGRELAALADATIDAALRALEPRVPLAVVGLGRLGGNALSYASDVDVLFVYDGETPQDYAEAERVAHELIRSVSATTPDGDLFAIDSRLRPEGKHGAIARSLDAYRQYYETRAEVWEFLALTKARLVAGDPILGHRFLALTDPYVYRDPFPDDWTREVRRMKARIENERIPTGEDPQFHLKLGPGTLSDVEFTAQLEQLRYGGAHELVRGTETVGTIERLVALGIVAVDDGDALIDAYRFCERARNYRFLHTGYAHDSLPTDPRDATHLARMLGYGDRPVASMRDDYRRLTRRCRRVVDRVFYGKG